MKNGERLSLAAIIGVGLGALSAVYAADAMNEVVDEIVVYGTPTELVFDTASLRVDLKQHARSIGRNLDAALGVKPGSRQVASADVRTRG